MITITNAIAQHYGELEFAGQRCASQADPHTAAANFNPAFQLPPLTKEMRRYFAASDIRIPAPICYGGREIRLLDLTLNRRTKTTKTFASLVMVARAIHHIRTTCESVLLVTPSSANKGSALRDAVSRAIEHRIVEPHQLRIAIVIPRLGLPKLWSLPLSSDPDLRALNPVFLVNSEDGRAVKDLTRSFVKAYSSSIYEQHGLRVWHTYDINNYRMADAVRAFVEEKAIGYPVPSRVRVHAQAVSSAFGLLGHHYGRQLLAEMPGHDSGPDPQWLLVQHLGTPDLVLHHLFHSFARDNIPKYEIDRLSGLLVQSRSPHFPARTFDLDEVVDSTFYSRSPATADLVEDVLVRHGGTGVVVSLQECLERYAALRCLLPADGPTLPTDPRDLREWALAMVMTGVLRAVDQNLVPQDSEILVHVTGCYSSGDYEPVTRDQTAPVATVADMYEVISEGSNTNAGHQITPPRHRELSVTN